MIPSDPEWGGGGGGGGGGSQGTVGRADAILTVGGLGIWQIDQILLSYYLPDAPAGTAQTVFNCAGRLAVIDRTIAESISLVGNDPLAGGLIPGIVFDYPFNFDPRSSSGDRMLMIPDSDHGRLRTADGGRFSVVLFAGRAYVGAAVAYPFVQSLNVWARRIR